MPLFQTGHKGLQVGTVNLVALSESPQYTLPSPPPGFCYNNIHLDNIGTVTAVAGVAAGNGSGDIVNTVDLEVTDANAKAKSKIIDSVRWHALWLLGYTIDTFVPIANVNAGAGGGAASSHVFVPTIIRPGDVARFTFNTVAAHATYHTTATAFAMVVRIHVDLVPLGSGRTNRKRILYRERVVDVVGIAAPVQFAPEVVVGASLFKILVYTQTVARGTAADALLTLDFISGGRYVISPNMAWGDFQALHRFDYRRTAAIVGVGVGDFPPLSNTASDQLTLRNGAAATVATSGVVLCYVEP